MEMTHAYVTLAHDGERVTGTMAADKNGPVAIADVTDSDGNLVPTNNGASGDNQIETTQVIPPGVAAAARGALENVINYGTGTAANFGGYEWGKTGTTENNGDAWFCGATEEITACVWVGHAESNASMSTDYNGGPVVGGTYPAEIWRQVVLAYNNLHDGHGRSDDSTTTPTTGYSSAPSTSAPETSVAPTDSGTSSSDSSSSSSSDSSSSAPSSPAPSTPAPSGGSSSSAGGVSAG
jgi:penicillin-binding protein 1A